MKYYVALAYTSIVLTCMFTAAHSAAINNWNWWWLTSPIWVMWLGCILLVAGAYLYEEWQEHRYPPDLRTYRVVAA